MKQVVGSSYLQTSLGTGTAVSITGRLRPSPPGLKQSHELHADHVKIVGSSDAETYPIQKKYHTQEYLRTLPHLRLRTPLNALLARLRSDCESHITDFFRAHSCIRVHPPLITSSDCEGAAEVFNVCPWEQAARDGNGQQFFRTPKYLTVSTQLHLEAYIHEHQAVWTLSPTFRAERSDTTRHLSEFYMLEAELRSEDLAQVMNLVEELIRHVAINVEESVTGKELFNLNTARAHGQEYEEAAPRTQILRTRFDGLKSAQWPRLTYTQAMSFLKSASDKGEADFKHAVSWDSGLQLQHERYLASSIGQGKPVFVTHYPRHLKPFYMLPSSACEEPGGTHSDAPAPPGETVANFDLLLPDLAEVAGGSLREHHLARLEPSMAARGMSTEKGSGLDWYLDLRRWGSVPHGGFGLGFDRLLCYLSGVDNVRDVVGWPRWFGRCDG